MLTTLKTREARARRLATRFDVRVLKSRSRNPDVLGFGGYVIVDPFSNLGILGFDPWAYSSSIEDVEEWLTAE